MPLATKDNEVPADSQALWRNGPLGLADSEHQLLGIILLRRVPTESYRFGEEAATPFHGQPSHADRSDGIDPLSRAPDSEPRLTGRGARWVATRNTRKSSGVKVSVRS